jgi:hypothetical protein
MTISPALARVQATFGNAGQPFKPVVSPSLFVVGVPLAPKLQAGLEAETSRRDFFAGLAPVRRQAESQAGLQKPIFPVNPL